MGPLKFVAGSSWSLRQSHQAEPRASASGTEGERSHPTVADRLRGRSLTVAALKAPREWRRSSADVC